ncbi:acyl carrier protein [Actinomyces gaoshouyii]|uniref:Acyl carrier protein n=1 Tax=Actinomyces gaoshouyii TaxID=1960083 RepID=A0A8H9HDF3_9ACTO|nr:acyl carrier protein [Actinomyces gaoshouyii]ARD41581.1 acyl carrier protein [Actinomyces gaoshouyii]GGO98229.1 acyl carrier protein [Actinomyces gaoshouyii]
MTNNTEQATDILSVVIEFTAEEACVAPELVSSDSSFAGDLDIDSLGLLTIATRVEERLGVTLEDSLIPALPTVGALAEHVMARKA